MKKRKPKPDTPHQPAVPAKPGAQGEFRTMTVALIREPAEADTVEVAFSESTRFYRLPRANPKFKEILAALKEAKMNWRPVRVRMEAPQGATICDVE